MTAVLSTVRVSTTSELRISVLVSEYAGLTADGVIVVDMRSQHQRDVQGVLPGALAVDAGDVLDRLTPGTRESLRVASPEARWVLISDDGHDAEWLAWHLQARGISGATFLVGGFAALHAARVRAPLDSGELATISAH
ncbi:MAG: rhodanese-like domain-containing protein [Gordonia amarae]